MTKKNLAMNVWFTLPRLGKDTFSDLMRAKVKYDSKLGFSLTSSTNLERALSIISSALNEEVELVAKCYLCDNPLVESDPEQGSAIDGPGSTLCDQCRRKGDALDLYRMKFAKAMENL
jgi:hypothetical protein